MESQLNRLLNLEKELTRMFDSDVRVALALLEEIRKLNSATGSTLNDK